MAKFIIDTDELAKDLSQLVEDTRGEYLLYALREAHKNNYVRLWLTPYQEKKSRVAVGTGTYSDLFEEFWTAYPSRNGQKQGKRPAYKSWCKVSKNEKGDETQLLAKCPIALEWQVLTDEWRKDNGMFIPMASTYLNQERWTDERPDGTPAGKKMVKNSEGIMVEVDI